MKRWVKICLWIALPLILIGGIIASLCVGIMSKNGWENYVTEDHRGDWVLGFYNVSPGHIFHGGTEGRVTTGSVDFDASEIENLEISIGAAVLKNVVLKEGEDGRVEVSPSDCALNVRKKNGTLVIEAGSDERHGKNETPTVTLYLPEGMTFRDVDIEGGACQVTLRQLDITGNLDIDCGAGKVEIELVGRKEDFNYKIDAGIGSVRVGSQEFNGIAIDREIHNGADKNIDIDCGGSEITITFIPASDELIDRREGQII